MFSIVVVFGDVWIWVFYVWLLAFVVGGGLNAEFVDFLCRGLFVCFAASDCI